MVSRMHACLSNKLSENVLDVLGIGSRVFLVYRPLIFANTVHDLGPFCVLPFKFNTLTAWLRLTATTLGIQIFSGQGSQDCQISIASYESKATHCHIFAFLTVVTKACRSFRNFLLRADFDCW